MEEKISIHNFLSITHAEINFKPLTVMIGPQASGKSVVAKLCYYFNELLSTHLRLCISAGFSKRNREGHFEKEFKKIFPQYTWARDSFKIKYEINGFRVDVENTFVRKSKFKIELSKNIEEFYNEVKNSYKFKKISTEQDLFKEPSASINFQINRWFYEQAEKKQFSNNIFQSIYIPAGRSFFSTLQKNVFAFLSNNIEIDPFLKGFGSFYETSKRVYSHRKNYGFLKKVDFKEIDRYLASILQGDFTIEKDEDFIVSKHRKVNLKNCSSGQQEILPLLLILSTFPFVPSQQGDRRFYIEEPEAHLFPISQKLIIDFLAYILVNSSLSNKFIITTHSPYILTSINNQIAKSKFGTKKLSSLAGGISFSEISAYQINKGKALDIIDKDEGLIDGSIIDDVSSILDEELNKYLYQ